MSSILKPGYLRWDGLKYVLDPNVEIIGPPGPAGTPGITTVIFRPGVPSNAPAYATWTEVVDAVNTVGGTSPAPITILFDDFNANCTIPSGTWDFGPLVSFVGSPNGEDGTSTNVYFANGCVLTHSPIKYDNVYIVNNSNSPVITSILPALRVEMRNSFFNQGTGTAAIYNIGQQLYLYLYDYSSFNPSSVPYIVSTNDVVAYTFEATTISDNTISITGNIQYYIFSSSSKISQVQTAASVSVVLTPFNGNLDIWGALSFGTTGQRPNLPGLNPGYRYFDTTLNTLVVWDGTTWISVGGGGTLAGDVTGPAGSNIVEQITGNGGNVDILCAQTTNTANVHYQPWSLQSEQLVSSGAINLIITGTPANSGVQVDVALQVISNSDFASWKLSIASYNGGSPVSVGAVPNPAGVLPDRYTPGAGGWLATLTFSSGTIALAIVSVPAGARAGFTYQVLPLSV